MDVNRCGVHDVPMYEITCPSSGRPEQLGSEHVISSHRVSTGHLVYLRCTCGRVAMWSSAVDHHAPVADIRPVPVAA